MKKLIGEFGGRARPEFVIIKISYDFVINCVLVVGVTVDVGKLVLNVHVPVNTLLFDCVALNVVFPVRVELIVFICPCVDDVESKNDALDNIACFPDSCE